MAAVLSRILALGVVVGTLLASADIQQAECSASNPRSECVKDGSIKNTFDGVVSPPGLVDSGSVPSRSGVFPTNLILEKDGDVNEIGQRPLDNSVRVWFTLHPNGNGTDAGVRLESKDFGHIDDVIATHCCILMNMTAERCASNSGAKLVTETGVRMMSFNDVEEGQRVYCVPQGVHFVWPLKRTGHVVYPKNVVGPIPGKPIRLKQLSEQPRVFAVDNFVAPDEIEELLRLNQDKVKPSEVGFGGWRDDTRTSSTSWDDDSKAAQLIRTRTFQILAMDEDPTMADTLQVLRYTSDGHDGKGEWYKPHVDWFGEDSYDGHDPVVNNGSNRFATMFLYLSDVEEGGSTVFPLSTTHEGYNGEKLVHDGTIDTPGYINTLEARYCCNASSTALRSKPIRGNAVLFYSQGPDGALDAYSLHGGCPPIKGIKWSANVWIWNRRSPDKSQAKDKAPSDSDGGLSVSFLNTRSSPVDIHWDEQSAEEDYDGLPDDLDDVQKLFDSNKARFLHQIVVPAKRELELNSYTGHAFVGIDKESGKVVFVGDVEKTGQLFEV